MADLKAKDIMTTDVKVARGDDNIADIAKKLVEEKIGGLPVVDEDDVVIGVISETDILKKQKNIETPHFVNILEGILFLDDLKTLREDLKRVGAYQVKDLMTKDLVVVNEDDGFDYVTNTMIKNSVNRVPVTDEEGRIKGIICRYDVIKALYDSKND